MLQLGLGLACPPGFEVEPDRIDLSWAEGTSETAVEWTLLPRHRGSFSPESMVMECGSPLGLWNFRKSFRPTTELRIYPDLEKERRALPGLFLRNHPGAHQRRQIGQGREFEKLREYVPGDAYSDIHWKTTAKRREPISKVYQVERTQEIYLIIDHSRLSGRLPAPAGEENSRRLQNHLETYLRTALVTMLAARQQGDLFGLITFSRVVTGFAPCHQGQHQFNLCRDRLYRLQPALENPDYEDLFAFVGNRIRRRSLLLIFSAADDPVVARQLCQTLPLLRRKHLVAVHALRPPELAPLFSHGPVDSRTALLEQVAGGLLQQQVARTGRDLRRHGIPLMFSQPDQFAADTVAHYFALKQKQAL